MAMSLNQITALLLKAFPDALIELKDLVGDNDHFEAIITSKLFRDKTRIQQHQMVYEALQGHIGTKLHALVLKTKIPAE